jgi:hypothetical protein
VLCVCLEFRPSIVPAGNSISEIKQKYEQQRDEEFQAHVCAKHPKRSAE